MLYTKRQMLKLGLGSVPLGFLIANRTNLFAAAAAQRPDSKINGVQIGIIAPYSFRGRPSTAEALLQDMVELGISATELQNDPVEQFAGAPGRAAAAGPGGGPAIPGLSPDQQKAIATMNEALGPQTQALAGARAALAQASFSDAATIPDRLAAVTSAELALAKARSEAFNKLQGTPARLNATQIEALVAQATGGGRGGRGPGGPSGGGNSELTKWRATVSMNRFKALRQLYQAAGVSIYGFKLDLGLNSPESDYEYAFNVVEALGANQLTMELPNAATTKRIGEYAAKRKLWVGYHAHTQARLNLWDEAFSQSPYNGANIDIGHYVAGASESPLPFIEKNHDRITSLHLKDRKLHNGPNMPWGQGDTPIKEVLELMKREHYTFPATIEFEYNPPAGSTVMAELAKCFQYAKDALA